MNNFEFEVVRDTAKIYHDFGQENADIEQARAIVKLNTLNPSTSEAEHPMGVVYSKFSRIRNSQLRRFTKDRMITVFGKLDEDILVNMSFNIQKANCWPACVK